jgi:predicted alpha/beta-hydrolase family hydrolase
LLIADNRFSATIRGMGTAKEMSFVVEGAGEVSALLVRPAKAHCMLVLAHGAGAGMRHAFMEALAEELAQAGVATLRYQFPYMEQRRKAPDKPAVLTAAVRAAVHAAAEAAPGLPLFAGGKSMGGRMTSQAAALGLLPQIRGIVFFGFPLHPPSQPGTKRADHLAQVEVPMLFLQGTRDAFAPLASIRAVCKKLRSRATLAVFEGADHSFHVPKSSGKNDVEVLGELAEAVGGWTGEEVASGE